MNWSPKPLKPLNHQLFPIVEGEVIVKGLSPMQRQRQADGTQSTVMAKTALRPADPKLTLRNDLSKGSLVEKIAGKGRKIKTEPEDPLTVVKAFLAKKDDEETEKAVSEGVPPAKGAKVASPPKTSAIASTINAVAGAAKSAYSSVPKK